MTPASRAWTAAAAGDEFGLEEIPLEECHRALPNAAKAAFCSGSSRTVSSETGRRLSTSTVFLTDEVRALPNLEILVDTRALRLEYFDPAEVPPRVVGVTVVDASSKEESYVAASREVIVSAGAKLTPQLLLISGLGPAAELEAAGADPVVDLPGVGKNLTSHFLTLIFLPLLEPDQGLLPCCFTPSSSGIDFYAYDTSSLCLERQCGVADINIIFLHGSSFTGASAEEIARLDALPNGNIVVGISHYANTKARGSVVLKSNDPAD
mmetsp:Transcript_14013/g.45730  ORF Transcript_14013/g.45730 Transcript_14013/m.45730 type:complete len:266 (+) Transcript_14013:270-1067(+)